MNATAIQAAQAVPKLEAEVRASVLVEKAATHIMLFHPFFGALLVRLKRKCDWRAKTMYTDAVVLGYNPHFVIALEFDHLIYIMCHEVLHCALGHPFRRQGRIAKLWNEAIDHVTNLTLNRDPDLRAKFPTGMARGLADPQFEGMFAEEVYTILHREQQAEEQRQREQGPQGLEGHPSANGQGEGEEEGEEEGESFGTTSGTDADLAAPDDEWGDEVEELEEAGMVGSMGDCLDAGASGEPFVEDDEDDDEEGDDDEDGEDESDEEDDADDGDGDGRKGKQSKDGEDGEGAAGAGEAEDDDESPDASGVEEDGHVEVKAGDEEGPNLDESDLGSLEREWQEAVTTAVLAAGGDVEPGMVRSLGQAAQQNKSFQEYIDEFTANAVKAEASWNRPARRFDVYLPSQCLPGVKVMVFGIDTSGSISDDDLALMESVEQRIMEEFNLKAVVNVYCDSHIHGIERFDAGEQISLQNAKGGGGTRFHPVFRHALALEEQGEELAGVVYLTDLEGRLSDVEDFQHIPTLWVKVTPKGTREAPEGLGTVCCLYD